MAAVILNPYINFNGNAEEALNFYKSVFGGELVISRFREFASPQMPVADEHLDNVMHGALTTDYLQLMAADTVHASAVVGDNISLSLSGDDKVTLTKYYEALSEGGTIKEHLAEAPWGDWFGMFTDKFGIEWLVNITGSKNK